MHKYPISSKSVIVWRVQYTIFFIFLTVLINILGRFNTSIYNLSSILNLIFYFIIIVIFIPLYYTHNSYIINKNYFRINKGVILKKTISININEVQYIKLTQTLIQRISKTCVLNLYTSGHKVSLRLLDLRVGINLKNNLYRSIINEK